MAKTKAGGKGPIPQRLEGLRRLMEMHGVHAYLVPSRDPHQSEYVPACWKRREWISGFTGSAGDVIVTRSRAGLWTDSRYILQAEHELACTGFELHPVGEPGNAGPCEWLARTLEPGQSVGFDPAVVTHRGAESWREQLDFHDISLEPIEANLVDALWTDRPGLPAEPAVPHENSFSGETAPDKLSRVRLEMSVEGAGALVITPLDAVAWLFNLRGGDIPFNPVAVAYALITREGTRLYVDETKVTPALREHLDGLAEIRPYGSFGDALDDLAKTDSVVWLDPDTTGEDVATRLEHPGRCRILYRQSPVVRLKAVKNGTEIAGFEAAHVRDGAAMVRFLSWLERAVPRGGVTEISAAEKLESLRREGELYQGPSFATISAYGGHAAVVHYGATAETDCELRLEGLYLVDSGGQYLDGTTDITRTVALGRPTEEQRRRFTLVLKGHIALARARFPDGTQGVQLDVLARAPLWEHGLDYGHGSGHGVGSYLNVHEGPQALSPVRGCGTALETGMFVSIEPGCYEPEAYGIRIENLAHVTADAEDGEAGGRRFYRFRVVTLCPIDRTLIAPDLLTREELGYLNSYHQRVRTILSTILSGADAEYLKRATQPL